MPFLNIMWLYPKSSDNSIHHCGRLRLVRLRLGVLLLFSENRTGDRSLWEPASIRVSGKIQQLKFCYILSLQVGKRVTSAYCKESGSFYWEITSESPGNKGSSSLLQAFNRALSEPYHSLVRIYFDLATTYLIVSFSPTKGSFGKSWVRCRRDLLIDW